MYYPWLSLVCKHNLREPIAVGFMHILATGIFESTIAFGEHSISVSCLSPNETDLLERKSVHMFYIFQYNFDTCKIFNAYLK